MELQGLGCGGSAIACLERRAGLAELGQRRGRAPASHRPASTALLAGDVQVRDELLLAAEVYEEDLALPAGDDGADEPPTAPPTPAAAVVGGAAAVLAAATCAVFTSPPTT